MNWKISFILSVLIIQSCKNPNPKNIDSTDHKTCYTPVDSLIGKNYLQEKYLLNIQNVQTQADSSMSYNNMVFIKGGEFDMGADMPEGFENMPLTALAQADEFPKHRVKISDFYMDNHEVTVGEFLAFVKATGYKTVAEYDIDWEEIKKQLPEGTPKPDEASLKAGALVFHLVNKSVKKDNLSNWWTFTKNANWKQPEGKNISMDEILQYPVTQVSWYDAMAYAKWVGKRLPTEAEYEYAMRGGVENKMYPWGNEKLADKNFKGNFLQGEFPYSNTGADGYTNVAPVMSFPPNAYGLYDIAGNVWEWTSDWYDANYYQFLKSNSDVSVNPQGSDKSYEVYNPYAINKVVRGGSFLCNDGWCSGYRNSRRMRLSPDTGMQHIGFRLVRSKE